uniref:Uncharacterized protein n=1 Tax=Aurantimonas manganoxydans TaxID=651183 RepID=A0A0P0Z579_9HYPH|nr:hypothetical protein [Aurantimonas manganoxydans SI85-9A1]
MGEIDQVHDPEDQGQAGRDQKQQDAELEAVERLEQKEIEHAGSRCRDRSFTGRGRVVRRRVRLAPEVACATWVVGAPARAWRTGA